MQRFLAVILFITFFATGESISQITSDYGAFSGNFQVEAQLYRPDSTIGAEEVPDEKLLSNSFFYLTYTRAKFKAGLRYEAYLNPIAGFDPRYQGNDVAYRFIEYDDDLVTVTAGDFYEQFGSGLIFRAYEERQLGVDNAVDGLRVKVRPVDGLQITGLIGKQRYYWNEGEGTVRGGDISIGLNQIFPEFMPQNYLIDIGASVISKYEDSVSTFYRLPPNVLAYSARANLIGPSFSLGAEYGYKYNDPHESNKYNYNPGTGLIVNANYFSKGMGASLSLHRIDNMDFRSQRSARQNDLLINFIPPLVKQQIYRLATIYPFATQLNGEAGAQLELTYKIPRNTLFGGKYGTGISLNGSIVKELDTTHTLIDTVKNLPLEYDSDFFSTGNRTYYGDVNLEISKRWSRKVKTNFSFIHQNYDRDIVENMGAARFGNVINDILVGELYYKFSSRESIKFTLQHMWSSQDSSFTEPDFSYGDWIVAFAEFTVAPNWYFSVWDEYNYFNEETSAGTFDRSIHYYNASIAYVHNTTRISLAYGRQREGLMCVGGVCRQVPSSNGFYFSVSSSF